MNAETIVRTLHSILEASMRLQGREEHELHQLLRDVYYHTMDGEPSEPPLGLDWSLRHGAAAQTIYEDLTGSPIDDSA
jgi:hypothetical protein